MSLQMEDALFHLEDSFTTKNQKNIIEIRLQQTPCLNSQMASKNQACSQCINPEANFPASSLFCVIYTPVYHSSDSGTLDFFDFL